MSRLAFTEAPACLGDSGDAVNIFNSSGVAQASVTFGVSDAASPYRTFDNADGLNNATISQLSAVGVNGAFKAVNSQIEIGSPGSVSAVPEPESYALLLAGIGLIATFVRKNKC